MSVRLLQGFISSAEVIWHRMRCKDDYGIRTGKDLEDNVREQRAEEENRDTHESPLSGQLTTHSRFEAVVSKIHICGTVPVFDTDK
jgi:hypothetical protein